MESPPISIDIVLRAFLQRLVLEVENITVNKDKPKKYTSLPAKPETGRIYYFSNIVGATITQEGYWGYTSIGWVLLG